MVEELRSFIDHNVSFKDIFTYYVYFAGWILKSFLPVFVLLAALTSIGILARRNEILAMKAGGLSLYRIAAPLLILTFFLSLAHMYYNEFIFADANKRRVEIKNYIIKKRTQRGRHSSFNIYRQINKDMFYTIGTYHIDRMDGQNIKIYHSENNRLIDLTTAEKIRFTDRGWMLYDGSKRVFSDTGKTYETFDSLPAPQIVDKPADFEKPLGKPEDMSYEELKRYIEVMKRTGGTYTRELVDLKFKLSYPLASFIVILICVPIASNPKRSGIAVSFAVGAGIALLYFVCFKVLQSLGHSGKIAPDLAAWLINAIFFVTGIIIMKIARK
jgi:lipopolysaccharide export system permease protein